MEELKDLYDTSAQDLRFGIGVMAGNDGEHVPVICIHYSDWPKEMLEAIRKSMRSGITISRIVRDDGSFDLSLATRERSEVRARNDHETGIIRFPSWDARLECIEVGVLEEFDRGRDSLGRFLLIVQTDRWAFEGVMTEGGTIKLGNIQPKSVSIPMDG
jgi:hypothetical protein